MYNDFLDWWRNHFLWFLLVWYIVTIVSIIIVVVRGIKPYLENRSWKKESKKVIKKNRQQLKSLFSNFDTDNYHMAVSNLDMEHMAETYDQAYIRGLSDYLNVRCEPSALFRNGHNVKAEIDLINALSKIHLLGRFSICEKDGKKFVKFIEKFPNV